MEKSITSEEVSFRWFSSKGRDTVPEIVIIGHEIGVQFAFENKSEPIRDLEICLISDPPCEYHIRECFWDAFVPLPEYTEFLGAKAKFNTTKITCSLEPIPRSVEIMGGILIDFKRVRGNVKVNKVPNFSGDLVYLDIILRATYRFEDAEKLHQTDLKGLQVIFPYGGTMKTRLQRKVKDQWLELLVAACFGWAVSSFFPEFSKLISGLLQAVTKLIS